MFELLLALIWPAAIPRLFVPIIPFLIIPVVNGVTEFFRNDTKLKPVCLAGLLFVTILLPLTQYFLKLQFLVLNKTHLAIILLIQLLIIYAIYKKNYKIFIVSTVVSMLIWSVSTVLLHKDIYKTSVIASKHAAEKYSGRFAYNDVNAVADWYLNSKYRDDRTTGMYINMDDRYGRQYFNFYANKIDYLLVTNEHNTSMEFSADEVDHLEEVEEFRYTIRGKEFFTKIIKFNK